MNKELENQAAGKISVRLATPSDALQMAKFRNRFRSSLSTEYENEEDFVRRCSLWMRERLGESSPWKCWIAEKDHLPVGNLWVQLIEKIPNPTNEPEHHAYITNFYVQENARGSGTGSMLLSAALAWCRLNDVHAVILWPTERSRSLYLRHGFAVRDDLLELLLKDAGEKA